LVSSGVVKGSNGMLMPEELATRAQAVQIIHMLLTLNQSLQSD